MMTSAAYAQDALFDELFTVPEPDQISRLLEPEKALSPLTDARSALKLYVDNCTAQKHPALDEERLISLCLCTASGMENRFSAEEILTMFDETRAAQNLRNSALRRAFAPCMPETVRDITFSECNASPKARKNMKNKAKVCQCAAQGMAATASKKAEWLTDLYIKYYKTAFPDPLAYYMNEPALAEDMDRSLSRCMQWHEYGRESRKH